jgi:ABC-type branched-subunit amino acid transport system substrate-binding protein
LSSLELRGKEIYFGIPGSSRTTIKARIGNPPTEIEGSLLSCSGCHGEDGKGKPEGGVVPSDITWNTLTKPYSVTSSGRTRPAYSERQLVSAVCLGVDPAGNKLHPAMPRYQISREEMSALIAYLKRLGSDSDPGLSDSTIKIGTILPSTGVLENLGRTVKSVLAAYIDEMNSQGGIYGRKLELSVAELGSSPDQSKVNIERLIKDETPFALVAGLTAGAEKEIVEVCETNRVPFIGPLTSITESGSPPNRQTFYLLAGIEQQARALIDFSRMNLKEANSRMAILYSDEDVALSTVDAISQYSHQSGWEDVVTVNGKREGFDSPTLIRKLITSGARLTLLLASDDEAGLFAKTAEKMAWKPVLLMPGSLVRHNLQDLQSSSEKSLYLALPSLPDDRTRKGVSEYRVLAERHGLPGNDIASQIAAFCSIKVLTEGLKLAGRSLTREKLVNALEGLQDFDTGLMPKIGFGPNRRIGAKGAYIVRWDPKNKQLTAISGWLKLD